MDGSVSILVRNIDRGIDAKKHRDHVSHLILRGKVKRRLKALVLEVCNVLQTDVLQHVDDHVQSLDLFVQDGDVDNAKIQIIL